MTNQNKDKILLTKLITEAMEDISIDKRASINNVINKFDFHEYKDTILDFKKEMENSIAKQLTNFLNSTLDLGLTTQDVAQILYNLKTRISFGLFGDMAVEFDKESFVDTLQDVLDARTNKKKAFLTTGVS